MSTPAIPQRLVAPSILAADFGRLREQVAEVVAAGARVIHVDVMDGHFVPPITMGPIAVEALRALDVVLDVHLMIERPERQIAAFAEAGAHHISIHAEATPNVHFALQRIREHGCRAGLAVNPATPPDIFGEVSPDIALCMTVNPGLGRAVVHRRVAGQGAPDARAARRGCRHRGRRRDRRDHRRPVCRGRRDAVRRGLGDLRRTDPGAAFRDIQSTVDAA